MTVNDEIMILCKVIDNFGDIGVVYRLCRSLSEINPSLKLNLVVSDLETFKKMAGDIDPNLSFQQFHGWNVFNWNDFDTCKNYFSRNIPLTILECFQCGRPEWLNDILFSQDFSDSGKISTIVNIEYLTAEEWADSFHKLKGATSSASVKKYFFMPGFTPKTGGLIQDKSFLQSLEDESLRNQKIAPLVTNISYSKDDFNILMFSYPKDFSFFFEAVNSFSESVYPEKIHVFVAPGAGMESFKKTASSFGTQNFRIDYLPYMNQEMWDAFLCSMDFLFIRGEDSFARAVLTGKPFLWNIYQQDEEYHLVKLKAFLDRLNCPAINELSWLYNRNFNTEEGNDAWNAWKNISDCKDEASAQKKMAFLLKDFLINLKEHAPAFKESSRRTLALGNLTQNLLDFLPLKK